MSVSEFKGQALDVLIFRLNIPKVVNYRIEELKELVSGYKSQIVPKTSSKDLLNLLDLLCFGNQATNYNTPISTFEGFFI